MAHSTGWAIGLYWCLVNKSFAPGEAHVVPQPPRHARRFVPQLKRRRDAAEFRVGGRRPPQKLPATLQPGPSDQPPHRNHGYSAPGHHHPG